MAMIESVIGSLLPAALRRLDRRLAAAKAARIKRTTLDQSIARHLTFVRQWAESVSGPDMASARSLGESFINLSVRTAVRRLSGRSADALGFVSDLVPLSSHTVLLGDVGGGKTTSLKYIARRLLDGPTATVPFLLLLRDLSEDETVVDRLLAELGIELSFRTETPLPARNRIRQSVLIDVLEDLGAVLLLDGLDEVKPELEDAVIAEFRTLALALRKARIVLTCRTGAYAYNVDNARVVELASLEDAQISEFAERWLGSPERAAQFAHALRQTPYADTAIRPLTLSLLCTLYDRYGTVPQRPKTMYRKVVQLLLIEWDAQRSITRKSRYADFQPDRKQDFLELFSYFLTTTYGVTRFSHDMLVSIYKTICGNFGLPTNQATQVVSEIESHTGLIHNLGRNNYAFAHKSLQEYLCGEYLLKLPHVPREFERLAGLPNEYAVAVALSGAPAEYLAAIVFGPLKLASADEWAHFVQRFLRRLVVERPDFPRSMYVGFALLKLAADCLALPDRSQAEAIAESLHALTADDTVRRGLRDAREYYIREGSQDGIIHLKLARQFFDDIIMGGPPERLAVERDFLIRGVLQGQPPPIG